MALSTMERRVAAALDAFSAGGIDLQELYSRLLTIDAAQREAGGQRLPLGDLLSAIDEAGDLGQDERQEVAWAAAAFWRSLHEG